ncbi:MAG: PhoH family protein [Candidatus Saccharibacteria bacterium]|nr:PhoH family protein [Candidatus Saccharibacteria bacterium]
MSSELSLDKEKYVLNLDAALNFPEILDITQEAPICKTLIIPISSYNSKLRVWEDEDSDRGTNAIELSKYLVNITNHSKIFREGDEFYYEFKYSSGESIILDPRNHDGDSQSTSVHAIAHAKHWKAVIITSKSTMVTDAQMKGVEAYFLSPNIYTGFRRIELNTNQSLWWDKHRDITASDWENNFSDEPLLPNEFVEFVYDGVKPSNYSNIGMFNPWTGCLEHLQYFKKAPKGIYPRNARQAMAFEAAYADVDRRLTAVFFYGAAGCGKTFISLGAALAQTDLRAVVAPEKVYQGEMTKARRKKRQYAEMAAMAAAENQDDEDRNLRAVYSQIWCCPPDRMMGDKMAAVPGDRWMKLRDNLDGYCQNIQAFLEAQKNKKKGGEIMNPRDIEARAESIMRQIHFTSAGQINGNSFSKTFFLVDEAEFMKESQLKMAIERIATESRIFICGDPTQIRNPYGWYGNPLAKAIRRFAGDPEVAILKFDGSLTQRDGAGIVYRCYGGNI